MNMNDFYAGKEFNAYDYLGAHKAENGIVFRTYAPNASKVSLIGSFNTWQEIPMQKINNQFYECYIPQAEEGMLYKYRIYDCSGQFIDHCDPYGFGMELRPQTASIIRDLSAYTFHDHTWLETRNTCFDKPLNIYELHLGSWHTNFQNENGWFTYSDIADQLIHYVKTNGYNYIELMPLSEHPCDESWGYQNTGFFSPTSRYGTATELMLLIDKCHENNIGVIMDFVPVHFAIDGFALARYDGSFLYEYPHTDVGVSEWGSYNFMHSRGEVRSFLQSAANYWLTVYHIDGLRMDAISRIIYWQGEPSRGVNANAVDFIKTMNVGLKQKHPTALLIAEDSTNFPMVTKSVDEGGLGFDYKWDMGWMNDTLDYFKKTPDERHENYHKLTFSMMYYYNEKYLLPLSHDEVVHGKATILQKMYGDYDDKFPQARAFYMYMYAHPGKKLNFMGNEFGQLREWDEKRQQDWDILTYPLHDAFHRFMITLHHIYLSHPALYGEDYKLEGFTWLDCHQENNCIYAFQRKCKDEMLIALFNFSNTDLEEYELYIPSATHLEMLLNSNDDIFGGTNACSSLTLLTPPSIDPNLFKINLPRYSAVYFISHE
nr:1,4-alpha-glucan branching protein GlgB [uncultured Cellulosilyticum sp.]